MRLQIGISIARMDIMFDDQTGNDIYDIECYFVRVCMLLQRFLKGHLSFKQIRQNISVININEYRICITIE